MADLGQTIVNRVKPLLDDANSAGYRAGYDNGFDSGYVSGYVSGEESVRAYVDTQVEISKKAIIGRGGDISSDAGLEDLPQAIFNIPADASLAHYTDNGIAYRKSVPVGAEKYALLKSIGGMTYKSKNLIPLNERTYVHHGITFTVNSDGVTANGIATNTASFKTETLLLKAGISYCISSGVTSGNSTTYQMFIKSNNNAFKIKYDIKNGTIITPTADGTATVFIYVYGGITVNNLTFKPMLNEGTALPYESYFEGLRDSKATEIVSYGSNLFDDNILVDFGFTKVAEHEYFRTNIWQISEKDAIFTNTSRASGSFTISAKMFYKNVGTTSRGLYFMATYTDGSSVDISASNRIQGEWFDYIASTDAGKVLDYISLSYGSSTVDTTFKNLQIARGSATEFAPYREPIPHPIPKALQDIDGYGWGVSEDCYNYADCEEGQFGKPVDRAQLEDLAWEYISYNGQHFAYSYDLQDKIKIDYNNPPMIAENYNAVAWGGENIGDIVMNAQGVIRVYTETANTKPSGTLYYGLAEPIITDISDILPDDNFIEVEGGGTLEFVNEHRYAVPATVKYTVKVGS